MYKGTHIHTLALAKISHIAVKAKTRKTKALVYRPPYTLCAGDVDGSRDREQGPPHLRHHHPPPERARTRKCPTQGSNLVIYWVLRSCPGSCNHCYGCGRFESYLMII